MPLSTHVIDFYDDHGALLHSLGLLDKLPDAVKTAEAVERTAHANQFAVVMVDDGELHPRFPINDYANTWLSSLYFTQTCGEMSEDAVKVAAARLRDACEHHDIDVPEKVAFYAEDLDLDNNVIDVTRQPPVRFLEQDDADAVFEETAYAIERADGTKHFPLNNGASVQAAQQWFGDNAKRMQPRERREFSVKVAAAADAMALTPTTAVAAYAGDTYGTSVETFIDARETLMVHEDDELVVELRKLAADRAALSPHDFAASLEDWDKRSGLFQAWDREVPDPYYTTYFNSSPGMAKVAKDKGPEVKAPETFQAGTETVTCEELRLLAARAPKTLKEQFGEVFAVAFSKDPVTQFKAAPLPLKKHLAALASGVLEPTTGN